MARREVNMLKSKLFLGGGAFFFAIASFFPGSAFAASPTITNFNATPSCVGSSPQLYLTWEDNDFPGGDPGFTIYRKVVGEPAYTVVGTTTDNFFIDTQANGLASDKAYRYQIHGKKEAQEAFSSEVDVFAQYCAPVLFSPVASCAADGPHISLSWSSISGNLSKYEIYRGGAKIAETAATTYNDGPADLVATTSYEYVVRAIWQDGAFRDSNPFSRAAEACAPTVTGAAQCNNTQAPGGPTVSISWNDLAGADSYQIYRKAQAESDYSLLTTVFPPQTTYTDNAVESLQTSYFNGGTALYFVKAIWKETTPATEAGTSANALGFPILKCNPFLVVVGRCTDDTGTQNPNFKLSWTATLSATQYNIYRKQNLLEEDVFGFIKQISGGTLFYVDPVASIATNYTYRVDAAAGGTFASNEVTQSLDCANPVPPSPAPALQPLDAYCVDGDSKIYAQWTPSNNASYYNLYRQEGANPPQIQEVVNTEFLDGGVESNRAYSYSVEAIGPGGARSDLSGSQTITAVSCVIPSAPALTAVAGCSASDPYVDLSWADAGINIKKYEIFRDDNGDNIFDLVKVIEEGTPEFSAKKWRDAAVVESASYKYQIKAHGPSGVPSSNSNIVSASTFSCDPTIPTVTFPVNNCSAAGEARVRVAWTSDDANTDHYEVFRQDYGTTPIFQTTDTIPPIGPKYFTDVPLPSLTDFFYKVVAVGVNSSDTATEGWKSITTKNCDIPESFTLNPPNLYCEGPYVRADLNWTSSANANSYNLTRNHVDDAGNIINPADTVIIPGVISPFTDVGFQNALKFDGTDDYVEIPNDLGDPSAMSLEFWFYGNEADKTKQQYLFDARNGGNWWLQQSYNPGGSGNINFNNLAKVDAIDWIAGRWNHVVVSASASNSKIYINGQLKKTGTGLDPDIGKVRIGARYIISGATFFKGQMDEVRMYTRELSASEATEHYQGKYLNESGLVGLWHFDEGSGQIASDSSNLGNDGVLGSSAGADVNDPSWVVNGIQQGEWYNWQAKAIGDGGEKDSNVTAPAQAPFCALPKPGLIVTPQCDTNADPKVKLQWSFVAGTTKYEIYRDGVVKKTVNQGEPEFDTRIWTDTAVLEKTTYTYWIVAIGPGFSSESDHIIVTTKNCFVLIVTPLCEDNTPKMNLSWTSIPGATGYQIYRDPSFSGANPVSVSSAPTSWIDANVVTGQSYEYWVVVTGTGRESNRVNATALDCNLPAPPALDAIFECRASVNGILGSTLAAQTTDPAWTAPGKIGNALAFDGTDDYVSIADNIAFHAPALTVSAWVKFNTIQNTGGNAQAIIGQDKWGSGSDRGWSLVQHDSANESFRWAVANTSGTVVNADCSAPLAVNQWYHVAGVYDGANAKVYVDGSECGNASQTGNVRNSSQNVCIGYRCGTAQSTEKYFAGIIDEARAYNRALSADEIRDLSNNNSVSDMGLIAHWNFDEGLGQVASGQVLGTDPAVLLGWSPAASATYYTIYRDPAGGPFPAPASTCSAPGSPNTAINTFYVDTSAQADTEYSYYIVACNVAGASPSSNTVTIPAGNSCKPMAPPIISVIPQCQLSPVVAPQNQINWTDYKPFNTLVYNIYRGLVPNGSGRSQVGAISEGVPEFDSKSWLDQTFGLAPSNDYYYWTQADGPAGAAPDPLGPANNRITNGLLALYDFEEGVGSVVRDVSSVTPPLDLAIEGTIQGAECVSGCNIHWIPGGLAIDTSTIIRSGQAATKIIDAVAKDASPTNAFTIEAWLKPADTTQGSAGGIKRIFAISQDTSNYNLLVAQAGGAYRMLFRYCTGSCATNSSASLDTPLNSVATEFTHVVYTRNNFGDITAYLNGVQVASIRTGGNLSTWNPAYLLGLANELSAYDQEGNFNSSEDRPWKGELYLVAAYDRALSPLEVKQNFEAGATAKVTTLSCAVPPTPNLVLQNACTTNNNPITLLAWNQSPDALSYELYEAEGSGIESATIFSPSPSGYIRNWLLLGAFTYSDGQGEAAFNTDYLDGRELTIRPRAGEETGKRPWRLYQSSEDYINMDSQMSPKSLAIGYAFAYLYSPAQRTVRLEVGSSDAIKVILNGEEIWSNYVIRSPSPSQDIVKTVGNEGLKSIVLESGFNRILVKNLEQYNTWGFYLRFTDTSGNPLTDSFATFDSMTDPSLVAHWKFNEGSGQYAYDSVGNSHGTLGGSGAPATDDPGWEPNGKIGGSLSFDGTNDGVNTVDQDYFSPAQNDISVAFWAKVPLAAPAVGGGSCYGVGAYMVAKAASGNWEWAVENDQNSRICVDLWQLSNATHRSVSSGVLASSINDDKWHQYAFTLDYKNKLTLYIDGDERATTETGFVGDMGNGSQRVQIGRRGDLQFFTGQIDDVRIYNRALSAGEIADIFSQAVSIYASNYKVTAQGTVGASGSSALHGSAPQDCSPAKPNVTVAAQCVSVDSQIILTWPSDVLAEYWNIYRRRIGDGAGFPSGNTYINCVSENIAVSCLQKTPDINGNISYADGDIASGTAYEYLIEAVGAGGVGKVSDIVSATALVCAPAPNQPVIAEAEAQCAGTSSRIKIGWGADTSGNTIAFDVFRKGPAESDFIRWAQDLSSTTLSYFDTSVNLGGDYEYIVRAKGSGSNNVTDSAATSPVNALDCTSLPPFPPALNQNGVVISTGDLIAVPLKWKDVGNTYGLSDVAEEKFGYRLFRRSSPFAEIEKFAGLQDSDSPLFFTDSTQNGSTIVDGQTYFYRLRAYNAFADYDSADASHAEGEAGGIASGDLEVVIPIAIPGNFNLCDPGNGAPCSTVSEQITLRWTQAATTAAAEQVAYNVYRYDGGNDGTGFNTGTATLLPGCENLVDFNRLCVDDDTDPNEGWYKVVATNLGGSTQSNPASPFIAFFPELWKEISPF